mgnify:FL=1
MLRPRTITAAGSLTNDELVCLLAHISFASLHCILDPTGKEMFKDLHGRYQSKFKFKGKI